MLKDKKLFSLFILVVLILVGLGVFVFFSKYKKEQNLLPSGVPQVSYEVRLPNGDLLTYSAPPPENDNFGQEILSSSVDSPPEGLPEDLPIDPNPEKIFKSYTAKSLNPPPDDSINIVYAYSSNQEAEEIYKTLLEYTQAKGMIIREQEEKEELYSFFGEKKEGDFRLCVTITLLEDGLSYVTISIIQR